MSGSMVPAAVLNDTANILRTWAQNTELKLKDITIAQLQADAETLRGMLDEIADKEAELTPLRNDRDALAVKLNDTNMRIRSTAKGFFGFDSNQYELTGGTRRSERKRPALRAKNPPKSP